MPFTSIAQSINFFLSIYFMFCDLDLATDMKTGIDRMGSLTLGLKQVCALMRVTNSDRKRA